MKKSTILVFVFTVSLLGCSSDDETVVDPPVPQTGVFIDSPIINIGYRTATQEGVTNLQGEYKYLAGESVIFFIGNLEFPSILASDVITPLNLINTQDTSNSKVINIIRLLQTLDKDGNLNNGITITETAKLSASQVDFNLSIQSFQSSSAVTNLIFNAGQDTVPTGLLSTSSAVNHFQQVLSENNIAFNSENVTFSGEFDVIDIDIGGGVYTGTPLGTLLTGLVDPDPITFSGEIAANTIVTPFSCCIAAGGLSVANDITLEIDDINLLNSLAGSPLFNVGDILDIINIEGDASTSTSGRIEVGLSYIFHQNTFSNEDVSNYPFNQDDVLLSLFFIVEENATSAEIFSAHGKLD